MKLGIIIDSSSGLNKTEANKKGWGFLPLHLFIDGKDYRDGIDLQASELFDVAKIDSEVRTSSTSPAEILEVYKEMTNKFDHIIVYSLSKKLSSQNNNLKMLAGDFPNIHVLDSLSVASGIEHNCSHMESMANNGKDIKEILEWGNKNINNSFTILIPKNLDWLVKGGRVNSNIASMAKMLKIVPQIKIEDGELKKYGKGRTFDKTVLKSAKSVLEVVKPETIIMHHTNNSDIKLYKDMVEKALNIKIKVKLLPAAIALHVGKGAVDFMAIKK